MEGFTEDQVKILQAAFDHMWARMASLHDDMNQDSARVAELLVMLNKNGVLTREQVMTIVKIEPGERHEAGKPDLSENEITRRILRGDLPAFLDQGGGT